MFCGASTWLCAQLTSDGFANYRDLSVEDGLPSNLITCFTKDSQGFMWIGTNKGLVRYDGSRIKVFQHDPKDSLSISGDFIKTILVEGDSVMWIGTAANGLNKFYFDSQTFKRYFPRYQDSRALPSEEVIALNLDGENNLWIGFHRAGLGRYIRESDTFESIDLPYFEEGYAERQNNIVKKIFVDKRNRDVLWLNTLRSLICYDKSKGTFRTFSYEKAHPEDERVQGSFGYAIQVDDGRIFIPTGRKGVLVFDPDMETWENYNEAIYNKRNNAENSYTRIQQRDEKSFWLGSYTRGLAVLDLEKGLILPLDSCVGEKPNQLCKLQVTCMDMDSENGHWIGSSSGIRLFTKYYNQFSKVKYTASKEHLKGRTSVVAIYPDDDQGFYYGGYAGEGLYHYNLESQKTDLYKPPKAYQAGVVHEMFYTRSITALDDSTLLVLSDNALFKFHKLSKRLELIETGLEYGKDYYYFHRLMAHSEGTYYITTRHYGLYVLDKNFKIIANLKHEPEEPNSLVSSNYIYEITEDPDGRVWVGTEDGFSVYDPKAASFSNFDYLQRIDSVSKLKIIFSIKQAPDSSLWFIDSRSNGMYLEYPYEKPYDFKAIVTGPNGLAEQLKNICFTRSGKVIMATVSGLSVVDSSGVFKRYTNRHGLPALNTLGPIVELGDGQISIGAKSNIVLFYPDSLVDIPRDIPIYLSSVRIFDEEREVNLNKVMHKGIDLSYLENFFSIQVGMVNFDNPEDYTLSYRLVGLSDEWITDDEHKAVFTSVAGGDYVFEARLQNKDDLTYIGNLTFPIRVIPPFWKRLWFQVSVFALLLLIGVAFYLMHIRSIRKEAALKTAFNKRLANMELNILRAQMNPHFLFNSLNSIRHQIISNNPLEADKYLVKFSKLVRQVLNNSRQQLISLKDELETLGLYIDLEASRFEHRFSFVLDVADDVHLEEVRIPPILIQPFVENAIWHGLMQKAEAGKVELKVRRFKGNLEITVEDDGIGREKAMLLKSKTAQKRQSMGIEITGNRLKIIEQLYGIQCSAEIFDLKNEDGSSAGTRVVLTLPLIYESEDSHT